MLIEELPLWRNHCHLCNYIFGSKTTYIHVCGTHMVDICLLRTSLIYFVWYVTNSFPHLKCWCPHIPLSTGTRVYLSLNFIVHLTGLRIAREIPLSGSVREFLEKSR